MWPHQRETIERTPAYFQADPTVEALLLGGSLAHGFGNAQSDVDVMMVVADHDFARRREQGATCFFSRELSTYPEGYVDGKYVSRGFLELVRQKGSEPARFAFQDAQVLFARRAGWEELMREIATYPRAEKTARLWRFQAQFEAWYWYCGEALKRENLVLLRTAVSKLTLFGGRIVLAHNERLYPFHKWFLRVLADVPDKPPGLLETMQALAEAPTRERVDEFAAAIKGWRTWEISHATWPAQFMRDSEQNWVEQPAPVDDL